MSMDRKPEKDGEGALRDERPTARFQRQHDELMLLAKQIFKKLDTRTLIEDAGAVRYALATFTGKLRVHAAMEQEALYPRLVASPDASVADKARELETEIGILYDQYFAFVKRWTPQRAIEDDPEGFCRETMMELHRLGQRMNRENKELYPLVDALEATTSGERRTP
jgi:hypothetical protein